MEYKNILKDSSNTPVKKLANQILDIKKYNLNTNSPDRLPFIKSLSIKSKEINFEEKYGEKYRIRFKRHILTADTDIMCVRFDRSDSMLANATADGYIKIFSPTTGKLIYSLNTNDTKHFVDVVKHPISCLRWKPLLNSETSKPSEIILATSSNGVIYQYSTLLDLQAKIIEENNEIYALDYRKTSDFFATAGKDAKIRIYDDETKKIVSNLYSKPWQSPGHSNKIFSIKFSDDDPNILISGGWDNSIYFWDIRGKKAFDNILGVCVMGDSIDCKQKQILVGTHKKGENLLIYDLGTRKLLNNIEWEMGTQMEGVNIYTAQFSKFNSDTIVAGATGFNQLKIFENKEKGNQIFCANSIPKGCFTVDYGNNSRNIAFGGGEGYIYLCGIYA